MARARLISASLGSSRRFCRLGEYGELSEFSQLLFMLIVVNCDDFGRAEADTFTVKLKVFPGSSRKEPEFEEALRALAEVGLIHLYEADENRYLAVQKFEDHQSGLHKRTKSRFPAPPVNSDDNDTSGNSRKFPEIPASRARAESNRIEEKGKKENGLSSVFEAVGQCCGLELELVDARTAQKINVLIEDFRGMYDDWSDRELAQAFRQFGRWYFEEEWKGHRPTVDKVREKWRTFREWAIEKRNREDNLTINGNPKITAPG